MSNAQRRVYDSIFVQPTGGVRLGVTLLLTCFSSWAFISQTTLLDSRGPSAYLLYQPLAQCSLIAIWAVHSQSRLVLRYMLTMFVVGESWMLMRYKFGWSFQDQASAAWLISIIVQTLLVVGLAKIHMVYFSTRSSADQKNGVVRFNLQSLLLWITVSAVVLGFVQVARVQFDWSFRQLSQWDFVLATPTFAISAAVLSVVWLWALDARSLLRRLAKSVIATAISYTLIAATLWIAQLVTSIPLGLNQGVVYRSFSGICLITCVGLAIFLPWRHDAMPESIESTSETSE